MDQPPCAHCGGTSQGTVCAFCGTLLSPAKDLEAEMRALEDFHALIATANPENQVRLIRNGFLPDHPHALVDAGLRCLLLIRSDMSATEPAPSAADRLRVIASKLRLLPDSDETRRALKEFDTALREYTRADATNTRQGFLFIGVVLAVTFGLIWYVVRSFMK